MHENDVEAHDTLLFHEVMLAPTPNELSFSLCDAWCPQLARYLAWLRELATPYAPTDEKQVNKGFARTVALEVARNGANSPAGAVQRGFTLPHPVVQPSRRDALCPHAVGHNKLRGFTASRA